MYIEIDGWKNKLLFSASHIILKHKKCSQIHGHTYGIRVKIYGRLKNDMIVDFLDLKKILKDIIKKYDHRVILPKKNIIVKNDMVIFDKYSFPNEDVIILKYNNITAENLALELHKELTEKLKSYSNISKIELCVDEGYGQGVWV